MDEGWPEIAIGDVCQLRRVRIDPTRLPGDQILMHFSIPAYDSFGGPVADHARDLKSQKFRVEKPSLLISLLNPRIPRSLIAFGGPSVVASTEMAVLAISDPSRITLEYLDVATKSDSFHEQLSRLVAGTTGSRQRVDPSELLLLKVPLPRPLEQRRIVDLMSAIDSQIASARAVSAAAERALAAYLDVAYAEADGSSTTVGSLATLGSGPSWKAEDEVIGPVSDATPVVGITSTRAGSRIVDASQRRFVRGLPATVRTLTDNSLLLIRTNGNRARIGNVYRVPPAAVGHAYSAFQIGAAVRNPRNLSFLFWFLSTPSIQARISEAASGSTGLGNVAVRWLAQLEVPWPAETQRQRLADTADGFEAASVAAGGYLASLNTLRATLMADLLSRRHEIPESYDRFLDDAA